MTTMDDLAKRARANAHDIGTAPTGQDRADAVVRRHTLCWFKDAADAMAADATAERPVYTIPAHMANGIEVKSVQLCATSAVAGDVTDTVILSVSKRDGAGGAATVLAQRSTDTNTADAFGNLGTAVAAFTPTAFSLGTPAQRQLTAAGQILTLDIAKAGAGKVLSPAVVTIVIDEL